MWLMNPLRQRADMIHSDTIISELGGRYGDEAKR